MLDNRDLVLNTAQVASSRSDTKQQPEGEVKVMKRSIVLLVPALALAIAACSTAASPSAVPATAPTATAAPTTAAAPSDAPSAPAAAMTKDIVETATEAGTFKTLLTAATAAGLVETLQGDGPFTVFAPTDAAFAALPAGTLDGLLADTEALKKVLLYHVVQGAVTADQVVGLTSATSVEGAPIVIAVKDGTVYLNDSAKVVAADVMASNGVIHVIDQVLLPPAS
jgi:transforming growth factor-beta-induced protein